MLYQIFAKEAARLLDGYKVEEAIISLANALACRDVPQYARIELDAIAESLFLKHTGRE